MFERFTKDARAVVVGAQEQAIRLRSSDIDAAHLLLAVLDGAGPEAAALERSGLTAETLAHAARAAQDGPDAEALAAIGIDLDEVRRRADQVFGAGALERAGRSGARRRRRSHRPFPPADKKSLELALREAIHLGDREITATHVVLGVLRADDGLLRRCRVDAEAARQAVLGARAA